MYSLRKDASINSIVVVLSAVEVSAYTLYWRQLDNEQLTREEYNRAEKRKQNIK